MSTHAGTHGDRLGEQRRLDEYPTPATSTTRCKAIAETTEERCRREALPGTDYCAHHR